MKMHPFLMAMIAITLALIIGCTGYLMLYRDASITVDTDPETDISLYLPFQTLEQTYYYSMWCQDFWENTYPQEIKLAEDLPALNGSDYFFPIYSGIVNALYPQTTQLGDDCFRLSSSADAFRSLVDGETDIFFGFQPTQEMLAYAESRGVELKLTQIANAYPQVIVSEHNPVIGLTREQLVDIFAGNITNWRDVGGNDEPILIYHNPEGSDSQIALEAYLEGTPLAEPVTQLRFAPEHGFCRENALYRNLPNAIGFTIHNIHNSDDRIRSIILASHKDPSTGNWIADSRHIVVYAITRANEDNANVQTVLDWITGPYGQFMVMHCGFQSIDYHWGVDREGIIDTAPNIYVQDYMPFRGETKIVKLDHETSLNLVDFLPRIDGAAAVFPVYSAFVHATYPWGTRLHNNDNQTLDTLPGHYFFNYSNTVKGYQYLAQKDLDIFFGGYPSQQQIAYAESQGTNFVYTPIAYEAFVFFVHKDNPIDSLTTEQLQGIYSGEITNWSQVGGHDEEIVAYQRNEGSGSQSRLIRFMEGKPLVEAPTDTTIDSMMGITVKVANFRSNTASIGFSFRYYMETLVNNPDLKLIAIDGVAPTAENIQNGTYPEIGALYAVTWEGNENENVQKLLDWVLSPEGQYIIEQTGYVPIGPTE